MVTRNAGAFGGTWSIEKLDCVEGYLKSFLQVMKNNGWANLWYIDAFSGEGVQHLKTSPNSPDKALLVEEQAQVESFTTGSSMRALAVSEAEEERGGRGFAHFVFIELDGEKLKALERRVAEAFPSYTSRCKFIQGDANIELPKMLASIDWSRSRGVAFVDPFATQFEWASVESFRGTCCDVWMLFPLCAVIRMLPTEHVPSEDWKPRLRSIFGDDGWQILYKKQTQLSLFGNDGYERDAGIDSLLEYATERYESIFPGVYGPAVLRNSQHSPLFALYAIVPNKSEQALEVSKRIATHLLKKMSS